MNKEVGNVVAVRKQEIVEERGYVWLMCMVYKNEHIKLKNKGTEHNFVIRLIKSRKVILVVHVTCMTHNNADKI
jgi:hypothetical protein